MESVRECGTLSVNIMTSASWSGCRSGRLLEEISRHVTDASVGSRAQASPVIEQQQRQRL